jgi:NADPH:quinone reductase
MRKGEWAEAATVSGIECVGLVKACPGGEFAAGTKVAAFMGGLGRTINGSYAEYTCPPATNVVAIKTDLSWEEFAVIPESYATAWTCLHRNLEMPPPDDWRREYLVSVDKANGSNFRFHGRINEQALE